MLAAEHLVLDIPAAAVAAGAKQVAAISIFLLEAMPRIFHTLFPTCSSEKRIKTLENKLKKRRSMIKRNINLSQNSKLTSIMSHSRKKEFDKDSKKGAIED